MVRVLFGRKLVETTPFKPQMNLGLWGGRLNLSNRAVYLGYAVLKKSHLTPNQHTVFLGGDPRTAGAATQEPQGRRPKNREGHVPKTATEGGIPIIATRHPTRRWTS